MSNVPRIKDPVSFLRETGLLFEINRQVLHPFGLALAVIPEEEAGNLGTFQLLDARNDKEGFLYDPEVYIEGLQKTNAFLQDFGLKKLEERMEELGYIMQNYPDPHIKKNGVLLAYHSSNEKEVIYFRVPLEWLETQIGEWFGMEVSEFLYEYDDEQTKLLYEKAKADKIILEESIEEVGLDENV